MSSNNLPTSDIGIPSLTQKGASGFEDYSVKYIKADLDDLGDVTTLQEIETRGVRGDGIVLLSRTSFTFNFQCFIVLQYLEKNGE